MNVIAEGDRTASGIVTRLRMVFLVIILGMGLIAVIGFWQMNLLKKDHEDLIATSMPMLVSTQQIERSLKSLLLLLDEVSDSNGSARLDRLSRRLDNQFSVVAKSVEDLAEATDHDNDVSQIAVVVNNIQRESLATLRTKRAIFADRYDLDASFQTLDRLHVQIRGLLETLAIEISSASDLQRNRLLKDEEISLQRLEQVYSRDVLLATNLAELTLKMDGIMDVAERLDGAESAEKLVQSRKLLSTNTRTAVQLVVQMPPTGERTQLASTLGEIRTVLLSDRGILNLIEQTRLRNTTLMTFNDELVRSVSEVSQLVEQLMLVAETSVGETAIGLSRTLDGMMRMLAIAMMGALLVVGAAIHLIVERQISRRMAILTHAVLEVADGNLDQSIDISGKDELGYIAGALDVFRQNAAELRRSNAELEKFAYVAAHDLRSPLRALRDLTEWTMEDEDNVLSEESRQYLKLSNARVFRLTQLLDDLLSYARVGKDGEGLVPVVPETLVRDIHQLADPNGAFKLVFASDVGHAITVATPFRQILLNLMGNAVKHHDRDTGCIEVTVRTGKGRLYVSVQDDGPGIPTPYHEKVFGLFQTLRPRDEVEGSGLGLAIIRKLVEQYGGTVRLISDPGQARGTRFEFDLPDDAVQSHDMNVAA